MLACGLFGVVAAVAAAARRSTLLASAAVSLGALAALLGGLGTLYVQHRVEQDPGIRSHYPVQAELARRTGYLYARSPSQVGLGAGALPVLSGVLVLIAAARRRAAAAPEAAKHVETIGRGVQLAAGAFGALSLGVALAAARAPLPGRDLNPDDPRWEALILVDDVISGTDLESLDLKCRLLEARYRSLSPPDPSTAPDLPVAARLCLLRREAVFELETPFEQYQRLYGILMSPLLADRAEEARILGELKSITRSARHRPDDERCDAVAGPEPRMSVDPATVSGISADVAENELAKLVPLLQHCDAEHPRADRTAGDVRAQIDIGASGDVTKVHDLGSTLTDRPMLRCLRRALMLGGQFPTPATGSASVQVSLHFGALAPLCGP